MEKFTSEYWIDLVIGIVFIILIISITFLVWYPFNLEFHWYNLLGGYFCLLVAWLCYMKLLVIIVRDNEANTRQVIRFAALSITFMLVQILSFALLYKVAGLNLPANSSEVTTTDYVYFSAITWTTVGYGDITPSPNSRLITASESISGYIYMGIFIGTLGSFMLASFNKKKDSKN